MWFLMMGIAVVFVILLASLRENPEPTGLLSIVFSWFAPKFQEA